MSIALNEKSSPEDLIREVRDRLGLAQEKFAAKPGMTLPTINRWENGRTKPSPLAIQGLRGLVAAIGEAGQYLMARFFPQEKEER